jgi:hypothetical protein
LFNPVCQHGSSTNHESETDYEQETSFFPAADVPDGEYQASRCPDSGTPLFALRIGKVISIMTKKVVFSLLLMFQMASVRVLDAQIPAPHCLPCGSGK